MLDAPTLLFISVFIDFFSNLLNIVMIILFLVIGVLAGLLLKPPAKNQVTKIIERDRRFIDFNINEESAFSLSCDPKKGYPPQRFLKLNAGYTGKVGRFIKRTITKFFGKEGTAYTWTFEAGAQKKIGSLSKALKGLWGNDYWNLFAENEPEKANQLEESKINVTVEIEKGFTPESFTSVSEEDIKREEDRAAAQTFWKGKRSEEKREWIDYIFILMAGFGIALALQVMGILRI